MRFFTENEEIRLKAEMKHKNKYIDNVRNNQMNIYIIILSLICFGCIVERCQGIIPDDKPHVRLFPDTWDCGQCGYSNYEGINNCGQCGASK